MSTADTSFLRRLFPANRTGPRRPIESLKTLAIVVPLTAMIWVYAENAQRRTEDIRVRVQFVTSNANSAATVPGVSSDGPELQLSMEGPRGQIEKFKQTIDGNSSDGKLKLALPGNNEIGSRSINIADAFKSDPAYYGINVVVKSAPSDLPVTVEPLTTIDVPIATPEGLSVTLQNVSFNPPRVRVSGPQSAVRAEYGGESPRLLVDGDSLHDIASTTTSAKTKQVSLVQPKNNRVRLSQSTVEMTYEVVATIRSGDVNSVFIDVRRPVADDGRSRVIIRGGPVIHNVNITGPSNSVGRVIGVSPSQPVKAVLEVTKEDVDKGELRREVRLDFSQIDPAIKVVGTYEVTFEVKSVASGDLDR